VSLSVCRSTYDKPRHSKPTDEAYDGAYRAQPTIIDRVGPTSPEGVTQRSAHEESDDCADCCPETSAHPMSSVTWRTRRWISAYFFRFSNAAIHLLARFCASAIWAGVIFWASLSRCASDRFCQSPDDRAAARLAHLYAST
jgi:hypothetical protein